MRGISMFGNAKWIAKDEVIDKYMTNYTQGGQYLTLKNVTDKKVIRNPWLAELKENEEVYTNEVCLACGKNRKIEISKAKRKPIEY